MSAKSSSSKFADSFRANLELLQKHLVQFEKVCGDENFTKLVDELNNIGQSTIPDPTYLESLTTNKLLKDICYYSNAESAKYKYNCTNKQKLFFLYGLYHNYCWRTFDMLYNPTIEGYSGGLCSGGTQYSQDILMIECKDLIKGAKTSQHKKFFTGILDDLEGIRFKLHACKESLVKFSESLVENGALNSFTRLVSTDHFDNKYFASVKMENNAVFRFMYKDGYEGTIVLLPIGGAHSININSLRNIIDTIFKIPIRGRLKKNRDKGKLLRLLLKLLYF